MLSVTIDEFTSMANEFGCSYSKEFSVSWSLGGTWADCWGNEGTCSPDSPRELTLLDSFLAKYFPNITFMQYRTVSNKVESGTRRDYDYYGGCTSEAYKRITYSNLINALIECDQLEIIQ